MALKTEEGGHELSNAPVSKSEQQGFPGGTGGEESACQCREHGFDPLSGKSPHAEERLGPEHHNC